MRDPELLFHLAGASPISRMALLVAAAEIGVTEHPPKFNRGPRVDQYLVGLDGKRDLLCGKRYAGQPCLTCTATGPSPSCRDFPWCARFARWCVETAARRLGLPSHLSSNLSLASALK